MAEKAAEPWRRLDGKVVMVTGASSGIGLEICLDLARAGCRIIAAARRIERLRSLCHKINKLMMPRSSSPSSVEAPVAVAVELDVAAEGKDIEEGVQKAWEAFGQIDALINNAGVRGNVRSPFDTTEEEWNKTMRTNVTGAWLVAKYVGIRMRDAKLKGSIINVTSIAGLFRGDFHGGIAYSSSKSAANNMTKIMALELGHHGIRVNAIAPGLFRSEITEKLMDKEWVENYAKRTVPLKTFGSVDPALTSVVRYLLHDSSEYVTGNTFIVDAGTTLPGIPIFSAL